ncbi:MAG TPA: hypothetical protein VD971_03740 [Phycisphaerales bacterium]|nr:hypothetical protein [Phycisphaerales bacterium]
MTQTDNSPSLVFVLGAGASKPFGLLTGDELRHKLCTDCPEWGVSERSPRADSYRAQREDFVTAYGNAHNQSIDTFLERNPKYRPLGKWAIAKLLAPLELRAVADRVGGSDWMGVLLERFVRKPEALAKGKVGFVSFNYDNLLETALVQWFGSLGAPYSVGADQHVLGMNIVHVHGRLEGLWNAHEGSSRKADHVRDVLDEDDDPTFAEWAKGIYLVNEERDATASSNAQVAREWIGSAKHVVILGFGFDPDNVDRIGARGVSQAAGKNVFATAHGLAGGQVRAAKKLLGDGVTFGDSAMKCKEFLLEHCYDWLADVV